MFEPVKFKSGDIRWVRISDAPILGRSEILMANRARFDRWEKRRANRQPVTN